MRNFLLVTSCKCLNPLLARVSEGVRIVPASRRFRPRAGRTAAVYQEPRLVGFKGEKRRGRRFCSASSYLETFYVHICVQVSLVPSLAPKPALLERETVRLVSLLASPLQSTEVCTQNTI